MTAVEGEWLAELGPMFFSVKESYKSRLAKRQRETADQKNMNWEMEQEEVGVCVCVLMSAQLANMLAGAALECVVVFKKINNPL